MLIADAQVHIWAADTPERPWPARHAPHQPVPFSKDDLLREMDAAGVQRAVLVPPVTRAPPPPTVSVGPQATRRRTVRPATRVPGLSFT